MNKFLATVVMCCELMLLFSVLQLRERFGIVAPILLDGRENLTLAAAFRLRSKPCSPWCVYSLELYLIAGVCIV